MTDKLLYAVLIPGHTQRDIGSDRRRNIRTQGILNEDSAAVSAQSTQPGEHNLQAIFSGQYIELSIKELEELFNASGFESIPFAARDPEKQTKEDGYYATSHINIRPLASQTNDGFRIDGSVTKEGTRRSHWRAIETTPTSVDSPWVGNSGADFAISSLSQKVRWVDETTGTVEAATPARTRETEHGAVDIYDADDASGDAPTLIFDLPYEVEYRTDCRVWDDYDRKKELVEPAPGTGSKVGSATVGSATVGEGEHILSCQWQRVFRTDHEFIGSPVVESGALRLIPDETNHILRAYRWDPVDYIWNVVQLGSSPWRLLDFDIVDLKPEKVTAHITFEKEKSGEGYGFNYGTNYGGTTGIGTQYALKMVMQRGLVRARFLKPKNESESVPSDLATRLAPIGRVQARSANEDQTLIARSEVK